MVRLNRKEKRFIRNYKAWYFHNITMPRRPRWELRQDDPNLMPTMFHDYDINEFTSVDPHRLMERELPAYILRFKQLYGEAEYERMINRKLPSRAEHWVETHCKCGEKMYTFLQRLNTNPFELSSETDSQDEGDSGNDISPSEDEMENETGSAAMAPEPQAEIQPLQSSQSLERQQQPQMQMPEEEPQQPEEEPQQQPEPPRSPSISSTDSSAPDSPQPPGTKRLHLQGFYC